MLLACETGDLARLRQLFEAAGVHQGDPVVRPRWITYPNHIEAVPACGPPTTSSLICKTIEHKQAALLSFLLATYPTFDPKNGAVLSAAFRNPDLDIFQILHTHCPSIVDCEDDDGIDSALIMALKLSQSPLLPGYLLDHGADPNNGGLGGVGPLYWAVQYSQPLEVVKKMVEAGAEVKSIIVAAAVEKQDLELVKFFIDEWWCEDRDCMLEWALKEARKTNKEKLITMIEQRLKVEEHSRDRDRGQLRSSSDRSASEKAIALEEGWEAKKAKEQRKWWRFWKYSSRKMPIA